MLKLMQADNCALLIMPTRIAILQFKGGFVRIAGGRMGAVARRQLASTAERPRGIGGAVSHLMQRGGSRIDERDVLPYPVNGAGLLKWAWWGAVAWPCRSPRHHRCSCRLGRDGCRIEGETPEWGWACVWVGRRIRHRKAPQVPVAGWAWVWSSWPVSTNTW